MSKKYLLFLFTFLKYMFEIIYTVCYYNPCD